RLTLRYLNLIDADDRVLPAFRNLIEADDDVRKQQYMDILVSAYSFLFQDESGDFDITTATPSQFSEKFRSQGLNGDTLRKAEAFFLSLASEAGTTVSKRITSGRTSGDRPRKTSVRTKKPATNNKPIQSNEVEQQYTVQQPIELK